MRISWIYSLEISILIIPLYITVGCLVIDIDDPLFCSKICANLLMLLFCSCSVP